MIAPALLGMALLVAQAPAAPAATRPSGAHVTGIRVRGNHTTPDEDVIRLAGVSVGDVFQDDLLATVKVRLDKSGRFQSVDVLKRYESFSDLTAILLVIVIEERAGITIEDPTPSRMKVLRSKVMWLPVLRYEDGYGFTYGARVGLVEGLGPQSRLSAPFTWGGERRATAEVERTFARGPLTRILATSGIWQRNHPSLAIADRRAGGTLLAERAVTPWLRVAGSGSILSVHFGETSDTVKAAGVEATFDTRRDPAFPRNAVYASIRWERLWFDESPDTSRVTADLRGFVRLFGPAVLAVRAQQSRSADGLPVFEQALLGGTQSLRGFPLGFRYGDRLSAGTVEVRLPVSSPRNVGRAGVAIFVDSGAIYDGHTTLAHAKYDTGIGAGWFLQLPVLSFRIDVAHGLSAGTRAHVTLGVTF